MKRYLRTTFESLHNRNYRLYFVGQGVSVIGNWMQKVSQVWLVLELTDSGTLLGVTAGLQQLPTLLLTPWGGLLADRVDRRRILLWTQSAAAAPALVLAVLTALDQVSIWLVMGLALTLGTIEALDKPARHTFVADLVDREHLMNAVALNNTVFNAGKVLGPAVAGVLISTVGVAASFFLNALSFAAVVAVLMRIRVDDLQPTVASIRAPGQLREGLRYVRHTPELMGPLALMGVTGLLAYEWTVALPLLAREMFGGDARVIGWFFTAMGAGAMLGGLALAGALRPTANRLIVCGLAFSGVLLATSAAPTMALTLASLFALGAVSVCFRALATSHIQLRSDPRMRGRTISLLVVAIGGTTPIGGPLIGWLAEQFGARSAMGTGAGATAIAAGCTWLYLRRHGTLVRVTDPHDAESPLAETDPAGAFAASDAQKTAAEGAPTPARIGGFNGELEPDVLVVSPLAAYGVLWPDHASGSVKQEEYMGKKGRVFVRGLTSESYGLGEFRRQQLAIDRVRDDTVVVDDVTVGHSGDNGKARNKWRIGPGDEDFLTQTIQVHFVELPPRSSNQGHGHQNEAAFYILEGRGYEIHDDERYDWAKDDLVFVHTDSVHRHFNPYDEKARALVVKAKSTWMFMGLIQQGRSGPVHNEPDFGPREDWSRIWTPGVVHRKKVIGPSATTWVDTPLGRVRVISSADRTDARVFSIDVVELDVGAAGSSGKYWKMADEVFYVLQGSGYALQWEVEAEISEKYYARIAIEPKRYEIAQGDTLYVPQNHVCQLFAADGNPLRVLSAQNRVFKHLGYDQVHYFEPASPGHDAQQLVDVVG